ncbi:MAG: CoA pyrophosphatase [Rhodospirillales bacterium]|nr:CoA pyrophosphatase [Rhodospirillales bacterium]
MRDLLKEIFKKQKFNFTEGMGPKSWPISSSRSSKKNLRAAAVLVPILDHNDGMQILLTERTETMSKHPGQIAFPGGAKESIDITPEETALRETKEEIGLPPSKVRVLGRMNSRDTATGYCVMPIVGLITPPVSLKLAPTEVAKVFEIPLTFIMDPKSYALETRQKCGKSHEYYVMPYNEHYIWGLTARILVELGKMLRDA